MNSREAFEKWAKTNGHWLEKDDVGQYLFGEDAAAWDAWQAATERAAKTCDELRHPYDDSAETISWVNGTFHCAEAIRKGNK